MSTDTSLDLSSLSASLPAPVEASNSNAHPDLDPQCVPPQLRRKMPRASPDLDTHSGVPLGRESEFTPVKLEGAQRAHAINALRRRAIAAAEAQVDPMKQFFITPFVFAATVYKTSPLNMTITYGDGAASPPRYHSTAQSLIRRPRTTSLCSPSGIFLATTSSSHQRPSPTATMALSTTPFRSRPSSAGSMIKAESYIVVVLARSCGSTSTSLQAVQRTLSPTGTGAHKACRRCLCIWHDRVASPAPRKTCVSRMPGMSMARPRRGSQRTCSAYTPMTPHPIRLPPPDLSTPLPPKLQE
ncbi:hypothetical protein C8R46DRAFT_1219200 [Mycena filopes]|nr:hypothetical protein C8R46DRAFT_1219200 [Mycena filopes]